MKLVLAILVLFLSSGFPAKIQEVASLLETDPHGLRDKVMHKGNVEEIGGRMPGIGRDVNRGFAVLRSGGLFPGTRSIFVPRPPTSNALKGMSVPTPPPPPSIFYK